MEYIGLTKSPRFKNLKSWIKFYLKLNKRFYKILYKRFYLIENNYISYSSNFLVNDLFYFNLFFGYCKLIFSNQFSYKQLFLSKLICIDVCSMYKTYRHIFGLPVNGQRTWSNANTTYYNNLLLRQYKLKKFSIFLNDSKPLSFKKIFLAEYINIFWKFIRLNSSNLNRKSIRPRYSI